MNPLSPAPAPARRKRAAQAWALTIVAELYRRLRQAGGPAALPFQVNLPSLPRNMAVRMVQEVGLAKNQHDQLLPEEERFPWSLRFGPRVLGPEGTDLITFVADRPAAARRARASSSPMMGYALDFASSSSPASSSESPQACLVPTTPLTSAPLSPLSPDTESILGSWLGQPPLTTSKKEPR